jgi:adenylate cyclase class 2
MQYEVEQKHRIDSASGTDIGILLAGYGTTLGEPVYQSDQYFTHPTRDFAKTDEALRIRTEGDRSFVTYKGPKIDQTTKTRRELELPLHASDSEGRKMAELFQAIGFTPLATVEKNRRPFKIEYAGKTVSGAYDIVHMLGMFVELELIVDETQLEDAKRTIRELALKLDLGPNVRRSYLEMLLEKKA